jgi:Uma2 family endonuclease
MFSPATPRHEDVFGFLMALMRLYVTRRGLGRVFGSRLPMRLKPRTLPEPDILFVLKDRLGLITEKFLDGPADLVVEVLSAGTRRHDLEKKRPLYHEHRVPECWFVDQQNQEIIVDYLEGETYHSKTVNTGRVESKIISGFWIEAEWLWPEPLPDELEILGKILGREFK